MPRSDKKVELRLGSGNDMLSTNLGTIWKLLRPSRSNEQAEEIGEEDGAG